MKTFTCAMCGYTGPAGDPEETEAELKEYFGDVPVSECEQVCDDCWEEIKPLRKFKDLTEKEKKNYG